MNAIYKRASVLLGVVLLVGCAGEERYGLHVLFPDEEALSDTSLLIVWVLDGSVGSCEQFISGEIDPEQARWHARLDMGDPREDLATPESLPGVPNGEHLFVAEGRMLSGAKILRGCALAQVKAAATLDVTVDLVCVCEPVPGTCAPVDEVLDNDLDDDCDGKTDECESELDCDDENGCTQDICLGELCQHPHWPDTTRCSDGDPCTQDDVCLEGVCVGGEKDCSDLNANCASGICNPLTGECEAEEQEDLTPCEDGLFCTVGDSCQAGVCVGGQDRDCEDDEPCTRDVCNENESACTPIWEPKPNEEGPVGDASCGDDADNDCDHLVDAADPDCLPCTLNEDCDDGNPCTLNTCVDDACVADTTNEGGVCEDGLYCTEGDHCASGVCQGQPQVCVPSDTCHVSVCVEADQECIEQPKGDNETCDDGLYCTVQDNCQAGVCGGHERDCDDDDFCTLDGCDDALDRCTHEHQEIPGAEGPEGNATCGNGVDDDCDGLTDHLDSDCVQQFGLLFDGADDFVSITQDSSTLSSTNLGVLVDFTTGDTIREWSVVAAHYGNGADVENSRWLIGITTVEAGALCFEVSSGSTMYGFSELVPLAECYQTRFQLLVMVDALAGSIKLLRYENGEETLLLDDASFSGSINTSNLVFDLLIGSLGDADYDESFFTGIFRQAAVFNFSDFSASDREMLFSEPGKLKDFVKNGTDHGFSFLQSDVIDYFDFGVGSGSTLPNLCSNANGDGALQNFPTDDSQWVQE